jgi:hypothetical protein
MGWRVENRGRYCVLKHRRMLVCALSGGVQLDRLPYSRGVRAQPQASAAWLLTSSTLRGFVCCCVSLHMLLCILYIVRGYKKHRPRIRSGQPRRAALLRGRRQRRHPRAES